MSNLNFKYKYYLHVPIGMIKKYGLKVAVFYTILKVNKKRCNNDYNYCSFEFVCNVLRISKHEQQQFFSILGKNKFIEYYYIRWTKALIYAIREEEFLKYKSDLKLDFLIVDFNFLKYKYFEHRCLFWYILDKFEKQYIIEKRKKNFDILTENITIKIKKSYIHLFIKKNKYFFLRLKEASIINSYSGMYHKTKEWVTIEAGPNIVDIFNCPEKSYLYLDVS